MARTDPFDAVAEVEVPAGPLIHAHTVVADHPSWAAPVEVPVHGLRVTFDEEFSPHVVVTATSPVLDDPDAMALLDPRTGVRVRVAAGYEYADGTVDVHDIADAALQERTVTRPADTIRWEASGDEMRLQETVWRSPTPGAVPQTGVREAVEWLVAQALPGATVVTTLPTGLYADRLTDAAQPTGTDIAATIQGIVDDAELWFYSPTGSDDFVLTRRPEVAAQSRAQLAVGPGGTLVLTESGLSRREWGNAVFVRSQWRDGTGTDRTVIASAWATTGEHAVGAVGWRWQVFERTSPTTQAAANAAARVLLRRAMSRGRSLSVTAVAAYWLRPGHTVTVQLPTGDQERHLVSRVDFDIPAGLMTVRTRRPVDADVENGE